MAAPVDASRIATNVSTAADPWTVNVHSGTIAAGNLLFLYLRNGDGTQLTAGISGWNFILENSSDASNDDEYYFYRIADGSEATTLSANWNAATKGCAICWRITGANEETDTFPGFGVMTHSNAVFFTTANANPTAVPVGALGSSAELLIIQTIGMDTETATFTAPTNYANTVTANSGTGGSAATNCRIAGASRQVTATQEDAGAWTSTAPGSGGTAYSWAFMALKERVRVQPLYPALTIKAPEGRRTQRRWA